MTDKKSTLPLRSLKSSARSNPPPLKQRILATIAEHPDWHAQIIARHLGKSASHITSVASANKISIPKMSFAERSASGKASHPKKEKS